MTSKTIDIGGKTLTLQIGELAPQATSAVLARLGDTVVLVTVVCGNDRTDIDWFPLSVEYIERLYAGGKIKGSRWVKREGRPSDEAILAGRLIDRSIRPLFPKSFKREVQVIITVLSVDAENEPDIVALNAVSAALAISKIPWAGPIAGVRMGYTEASEGKKATVLVNPTTTEAALSQLDVVVSQSKEKTVMIEAGALQVAEDVIQSAIEKAHVETRKIIAGIEELVKKVGQEKLPVPEDSSLSEAVSIFEKTYKSEITKLIEVRVKKEGGGNETEEFVTRVYNDLKMKDPESEVDKKTLGKGLEKVMFKMIRDGVVNKNKRADGRAVDEVREISAQVSFLPRTHGSALFSRGITQALSIATLGSPRLELLIESADGEEKKRYIHHYSGLPYSFGQAGRMGFTSRREIGHGALAERALSAVIPTQADFPYTIRVVSEVLSQNGSSSMASTCGSTLALMDAGVPITAPVAGISIGMMSEGDKYVLLTDIIGLEDFSGDMDFKVAGTEKGVTAIQLDVKIDGLTDAQIVEIFARAKTARLEILKKMLAVLPESRKAVSAFAPKIEVVHVPVEKIGEVIGPGGRVIRNIIAETGAQVDVEDDGSVTISGTSQEAVAKGVEWVKGLVREVQPGEEFEGEVKRILPFGAFVEVLPGKEGMVHVSQMATGFVKDPSLIIKLGQMVKVKVIEIDDQGRMNLTMTEKVQMPDQGQGGSQTGGGPARNEGGSNYGSGPSRPPRREFRSDAPYRENASPVANNASTPVVPAAAPHPLTMQFRRERFAKTSGRPGSRPTRPSRFRPSR